MSSLFALLLSLTLLPLILATSSRTKTCTSYLIPVHPTSLNLQWGAQFSTNFDVVDFISNLNSRTAASSFNPFKAGAAPVLTTARYEIAGTFCSPKSGGKGVVLLLSHGLNFDGSYWDPAIQAEKYSFVDWAIARGYSVFYYDRLGVGKSTKISGYTNQASIQVSILTELTTAIRAGKYTGGTGVPEKLVLVGHSFGSVLSAAVVTAQPELAEGLVLTGFSFNGTNGKGFLEAFQPRIASGESGRWEGLDTGYLTPTDIYSNVNVFFKAPDYDVEIVKYAHRNRQPFGINEAISGNFVDVAPFSFTGPAMVIAGQFDLIFCTGQCDDVIKHPAKEIFNNTRAFEAISYPGAGHGLNFAANATGAFELITDFLSTNGL